ncbi:4-diphosphocytidyl-2-C-methyl-D-erythritol kinase [Candidatus Profftia lariciata]|uniref:4-(cytidine 5'-diphospho)-2-C-methyl-D-erythritol kinase n=1 Tax=Candidatus Profftia lariciata TaxID=1987921 RepID=UPI001D035A7B|nr:4-(cytidine 5'-diphospho)-2-C-methyl-D-erythritol kinase [Candidatus Profftia lariciata]UDG81766.1 4-diphosphocytidyl-2-C-methyl-D-erythritol kinase [Candidatus Profftia lariciata]
MIFTKNIWLAPAKLNLFLYITSRYPNGYHNLQTLFQFLEYSDQLIIIPRNDGQINLLTPLDGVPNNQNMIIRAAKLLRQKIPESFAYCGADISIKKIIPIGAGLGGGSSNAATVLVALNKLWKVNLSHNKLVNIGFKLGADVPIFIQGSSYFSEGAGKLIHPAYPKEKWYLIADPGIHISTSMIFNDPDLNIYSPVRSYQDLLLAPYTNDCEYIVRKRFHKIEMVLLWLLEYAPSRLTGTGACAFSEFNSKSSALRVLNKVPGWFKAFVARGINISPLYNFNDNVCTSQDY